MTSSPSGFKLTLLAATLTVLPLTGYAAGSGGGPYGGSSYGDSTGVGDGGAFGLNGANGTHGGAGGIFVNGSLDISASGTDGSESAPSSIVGVGAATAFIGGGGGGGGTAAVQGTPTVVAHGGNGGNGATFRVSVASFNNGVIAGGGGGAGGDIHWLVPSPAGADIAASVRGGNGGAGAELASANISFINAGTIWGGGGGSPGRNIYLPGGGTITEGFSGSGGAGLVVTSDGNNITNTGTIRGGDAGAGALLALGGNGVRVSGNLGSIIQAGIMAGGMNSNGVDRNEAVLINGQGNTLTLHPRSITTGNVIFNGADNRLQIGTGSAATAAIAGSVSLGSGGVFQVRATPAAFDRLNVTGNAVVNQARVDVQAAPGAYSETFSQVILHADATLTGTRFTGVTSNLAYLTPTLSYSADDRDVTLLLTRAPSPVKPEVPPVTPEVPPVAPPVTPVAPPAKIRFADLVNGGNGRAVADAAETLGAGHAVYDAAIGLPQGAPQDFFAGLSGEMHAGVGSGLSMLSSTVRNVPLNQLRGNLNAGFAPGSPTAAAGTSDAAPSAAALPSSLARPAWAQIVGNWQRIGATGNTSAVRQHTGGVFVGADHGLGNGWRLGGALGYTDAKQRVDDLASKADISSYSAVLYGGKAIALGAGKLNVMAGASYTWHDIHTERRIDGGGLNQTLDSNYGGNTTQVFSEVGYAFGVTSGLTLEPYAGVAWAGQRTRGFSESGGSAALSGDSTRNNTTTSSLGLRATQEVTLGTLAGAVSGGLSWRHAFGDLKPESRLAFDAGDSFTVTGAPIARDAALVEAGFDARIARTATLGIAYAGQFGGGNRDQTASVNLRWAF